jgi:hypothetical protein
MKEAGRCAISTVFIVAIVISETVEAVAVVGRRFV